MGIPIDDVGFGLDLESVQRLTKDIKNKMQTLSRDEARYLVDAYYQIQEYRKATMNQVRSLNNDEPHLVIDWLSSNYQVLENQLKNALGYWTDGHPVGVWSKSIVGIGPVISAGLLAHIDIEKARYAGNIWRFAGLDSTVKWEGRDAANALIKEIVGVSKEITDEMVFRVAIRLNRNPELFRDIALRFADDSETLTKENLIRAAAMRPWNADLKVLCWKIGESFMKTSNNEKDFYGKVYKTRRELESARNEEGLYSAQAATILATKNIGKSTEAYKWYSQGKLPPAHILQRAKRYAVKLFLSHWQYVAYYVHYKVEPPKPYIIAIQGHGEFITPPNFDPAIIKALG